MEALMRCLAGQFLNETVNDCFPCLDGTFNSAPGSNTRCEPCSTGCYERSREVFQYGCNSTHDLFCVCAEGYTRSLSNPKRCTKMKLLSTGFTAVYDFIKNAISSNFTSLEQANFSNPMTNTSDTAYLDCSGISSLSVWSLILIVAAILGVIGIGCALLIWFIWRKKSKMKRQQAIAAMILDPEKGPLVEQQLLGQHIPLWGEENESSAVSDARNTDSLSQFNSGGSDQAGILQSSLAVDSSDSSVTATLYDRPGEILLRNQEPPSASLCAELESQNSSLLDFDLNLQEDSVASI